MQGRTSMCDCGNILNAFCKGQKEIVKSLFASLRKKRRYLHSLGKILKQASYFSLVYSYLYGYAKKILSLAVNISISIA